MEDSALFRVIKPLVSIVCLLLVIESFRTGTTLSLGRTGIDWISQASHPARFWVANLVLVAFAVLGLIGPVHKKRK
ncbi:hypothetical protein D3880_21355 [Pseudomonas cavernae]|uniref:Uncharacterized protein n=1 Tax=Pseudomonas cavernae TaxID=2320867 RepID=A0A385ZA72_9PSED|nr:hypothetical protein [Pseudomonas cavernae]AYC34762.1 hypothetical protein D3880_21355 [Pseudomonas cavernae]